MLRNPACSRSFEIDKGVKKCTWTLDPEVSKWRSRLPVNAIAKFLAYP